MKFPFRKAAAARKRKQRENQSIEQKKKELEANAKRQRDNRSDDNKRAAENLIATPRRKATRAAKKQSTIVIAAVDLSTAAEPTEQIDDRNPYEGEIQYVDDYFSDVETDEPDLGPTYEVEEILARRFNKNLECYEFYVKWKGYSDSANSWQIEDELTSFTRDVDRFMSKSRFYCIKPKNINSISF